MWSSAFPKLEAAPGWERGLHQSWRAGWGWPQLSDPVIIPCTNEIPGSGKSPPPGHVWPWELSLPRIPRNSCRFWGTLGSFGPCGATGAVSAQSSREFLQFLGSFRYFRSMWCHESCLCSVQGIPADFGALWVLLVKVELSQR